jgi:hypothetical protein
VLIRVDSWSVFFAGKKETTNQHEKTENRIFFNAETAEYAEEEFNRGWQDGMDKKSIQAAVFTKYPCPLLLSLVKPFFLLSALSAFSLVEIITTNHDLKIFFTPKKLFPDFVSLSWKKRPKSISGSKGKKYA